MSNAEALPLLPEPARQVVYNESKGYTFDAYTADQMRAYGLACAAAMLDRIAHEPPINGNLLAQARVLMQVQQIRSGAA